MYEQQQQPKKSRRGFASMDKARQRELASKGGRNAHTRGTAHQFDSTQAALAAKKGHELGAAHEFTSEEAAAAGRKGGIARAAKLRVQNRAAAAQTRTPPTELQDHSNHTLPPQLSNDIQSAA